MPTNSQNEFTLPADDLLDYGGHSGCRCVAVRMEQHEAISYVSCHPGIYHAAIPYASMILKKKQV